MYSNILLANNSYSKHVNLIRGVMRMNNAKLPDFRNQMEYKKPSRQLKNPPRC